jgi:hypothetical protein
MNGINEGVELLTSPGYPASVTGYASTFAKQKHISIDVFLSSHAGQFALRQRYKPGDKYDPNRFVDPAGGRARRRCVRGAIAAGESRKPAR